MATVKTQYLADSSGRIYAPAGLVVPATSGTSIMIGSDTSNANGWADIIGHVDPKTSGANTPLRATYMTAGGINLSDYAFASGDFVDFSFHIPHDYLPGSDLYFHAHWSHNGEALSGDLVLDIAVTYAKGHNQANFSTGVVPQISLTSLAIETTPQFRHRIDEIQLSAASPSASQLNSSLIEPDGLILMTLRSTTVPSVSGGAYSNKTFIHFTDLHYQTTGIKGTKNKAPNFYQ